MLKRFLPRTLLGRFILIIVTPLVLLQAVTAVVFYERHWRTIQRYQTGALAGEVAMLTHLLERDATAETQNWIGARALKDFNLVAVFNPGDTLDVTRDRGDGSIESDLRQALLNRLNRPFRLDIDWQEERVRINVATSGGVLAVEAPLKRVFSSTTYIFILWMVGAAVVLLVVALAFLRNQIRPVKRLATAMDEFGKGRDVSPLKPQGATEVRQAGTAFGRMQARIGRQITQRTEMLAGVSHDLKTVLTRMRLQVAMLGDKPGSKDLSKDIRDMEVMLEGYLAFARGAGGEATRDVRLGPLLAEAVEDAGRDGRKNNLEIDLAAERAQTLCSQPDPQRPRPCRKYLGPPRPQPRFGRDYRR